MLMNETSVERDRVTAEVAALQRDGFRLVTMTCVDAGDAHEIIYHFDKNYELRNLRLRLPKADSLPSISSIYFAAILVENEMKDMFGLTVDGLAIDYKGRFILSEGAPSAPLSKNCGMPVEIKVKTPDAGGAAS